MMLDSHATSEDHAALLYGSDDGQLVEHVAGWLFEHLAREQPALAIVSPARSRALASALDRAGLNVGALRRRGLFVSLDAPAIVRSILENEPLSWTSFERRFGDLVRELATRGPLRIYGEGAGLLWKDGKREVALELEGHWNRLRSQVEFELLCSYDIDVFGSEFATGSAAGVIRAHAVVLPFPAGDSSR